MNFGLVARTVVVALALVSFGFVRLQPAPAQAAPTPVTASYTGNGVAIPATGTSGKGSPYPSQITVRLAPRIRFMAPPGAMKPWVPKTVASSSGTAVSS